MKCPRLRAVGLLLVVKLPYLTQEALMKEYYKNPKGTIITVSRQLAGYIWM
jgi:hypothetical protein